MAVITEPAEAAEVEAAPAIAAAAVKAVPATTAGAVSAPMAAAMIMVKTAVGRVRVSTDSMRPDIRSRSMSRPRARRCFTASSLRSSASATILTDWPSR